MRRWDNFDILREVDRQQREITHGAPLGSVSGFDLMELMAGGHVTEEGLWRGFVQELLIAQQAGLLTFTVEQWAPNPRSNPHYYLQTLRNFALTVAGQDRARGQLVVQPGPDPDEDDGRLISGLLLRQVGDAISQEYTPAQIPLFLGEAGIPPAGLPMPDGLVGDPAAVLLWLADQGSEGRRALRGFLGRWLDDRLISGPSGELRRTLIDQFALGGLVRSGRHPRRRRVGRRCAGQRTCPAGCPVGGPAPWDQGGRRTPPSGWTPIGSGVRCYEGTQQSREELVGPRQ